MSGAISKWLDCRLGDIGQVLIGLTYSPTQIDPSGTLVLRSSNIQNGQLALDDTVRVVADIPDDIRVRSSDILICVRNGSRALIGKSLFLDERVEGETFGAFMAVYRSRENDYLRFFFESETFKRQVDEHLGATINQITNRSLKGFEVCLPPVEERRLIEAALADATQLVWSLEGLIAKKRAIRQGITQQLLSGATRLPGFAAPWSHRTLGDMGQFLKGRGVKRDDVRQNGVPCIRYGELYTTFRDYTSSTVSFVDSEVAATALPLRNGDLLFAGSGETREEIGMCVAYTGDEPAVAGGDIIVLRGSDFNPTYIAVLLNSPEAVAQKARLGQGDAVVHISSRALASIELVCPDRAEQDAIAGALVDADREIELLAKRLAKARAIKQGMMQELLTGRTRIVAQEASA